MELPSLQTLQKLAGETRLLMLAWKAQNVAAHMAGKSGGLGPVLN